jgi:hypothetical protein
LQFITTLVMKLVGNVGLLSSLTVLSTKCLDSGQTDGKRMMYRQTYILVLYRRIRQTNRRVFMAMSRCKQALYWRRRRRRRRP